MATASEHIAKTGFLVSSASYVLFWASDVLRPGFVARYLSLHVFLLAAVVFGVWWAVVVKTYDDWPMLQYFISVLLGLVCVAFVWRVGEPFADMRVLAAGLSFFVPSIVLVLVRRH